MVSVADEYTRPITFILTYASNSVSGPEKFHLQLQNSSRKLILVLSVSVFQLDLESSERRSSSGYPKSCPFLWEIKVDLPKVISLWTVSFRRNSILEYLCFPWASTKKRQFLLLGKGQCFLILWFLYEKVAESSHLTSLKNSSSLFR